MGNRRVSTGTLRWDYFQYSYGWAATEGGIWVAGDWPANWTGRLVTNYET